MIKELISLAMFIAFFSCTLTALEQFEKDVIKTSAGNLTISFIGHGSLLLNFDSKNIYIDPFGKLADYSKMPKADLVLITHEHFDHLDTDALASIRKNQTEVIITEKCMAKVPKGIMMKNNDSKTIQGIEVVAVPAYNVVHKRDNGEPFHSKGNGNGYVLILGDNRIYIAGDTENIPEMKNLKNIDIAFLPMNLPYTMTPEMATDAAKMFNPTILYPYHFGETDTGKLVELLKDTPDIEVRIRKMK